MRIAVGLLHEILRLDQETGKLFWRTRPQHHFSDGTHSAARKCAAWNGKYAGKEAFTSISKAGYAEGQIDGVHYLAHQVCFALSNGYWAPDQIDHKNGVRSNNTPPNLSDATRAKNGKNQKMRRTNTSGITGVVWHKNAKKWAAQIYTGGKMHYLGLYSDKNKAREARKAAEQSLGFSELHGLPQHLRASM